MAAGICSRSASGANELNVFLPRTRRDAGPKLSGFRMGDRIRVTGIASQYCTLPPYDRYFQILIPSPAVGGRDGARLGDSTARAAGLADSGRRAGVHLVVP